MRKNFLLDDGRDTSTLEKDWEDLANLVRHESYKQLAALKNTITATSVAARLSTSKLLPPKNNVFSSRPTLRQMMQQYNNRPAHTAQPIRPQTAAAKARTTQAFQSDRIEHYQVPGLKGRILRPLKNS